MIKDFATEPIASCQAAQARERLLRAINAQPSGPHPDFPGYTQARIGAAARLVGLEGWRTWPLGGFVFADGSVLRPEALRLADPAQGWYVLSAPEADWMLEAQTWRPLEVRLLHTFQGADGRCKASVAEARFEHVEFPGGWRLRVEYEPYMDSPLYGLEVGRYAALADLPLEHLRVRAVHSSQAWRLERIAMHPDWIELLECCAGGPF